MDSSSQSPSCQPTIHSKDNFRYRYRFYRHHDASSQLELINADYRDAYQRDLVNWPLAFLEFIKVTGLYGAAGRGSEKGERRKEEG